MNATNFYNIKNCTESDTLAIVNALFNLVNNVDDIQSFEESQILYNALVDKLNLKKHSEKVCNAFIDKHIKEKKLTIFSPSHNYSHPFDCKGKLIRNFEEDEEIYDDCGSWKNNTISNVNLVRAVFAGDFRNWCKIIAMTFFANPKTCEKNGYKILSSIPVPAKIKKACQNYDTVKPISDTLNLTEEEALLLLNGYRILSVKEFFKACERICSDSSRIDLYAVIMGKNQKEIRKLLKKDGKLVSYGLFSPDGKMRNDILEAIYEKDIVLFFTDLIKNEGKIDSYKLDSFSINQRKTNLAVQFLKSPNPCNILLYGAPGAGKTEYAKSLIKTAGLKMNSYKNEMEYENSDSVSATAISRLNCYLSLKRDDSILVVDEAESVLKTTGNFMGMKFSLPQKGIVNKMLENSQNKVIWILNYTDELDESTLRRFTYSIRFNAMPKETLRSIAEDKFSSLKMPQPLITNIVDMCDKYQVTGASVDNIVKAVKSMDYTSNNTEKIMTDVSSVLEANSSLVFGKKKIRDTVKNTYNLDILNTTIPAPEIVEMIQNAITNKNESFGQASDGIRILFYGLSGTGKTELARYISEKTGKKLLIKRVSDIIDKFVGETEQNISAAFEEAEETDSILLFDEADTFFANRENATHSWERTMVNEFLTQMEEFSGILICTTNLRKIMEPAMQRRFHILTEFKPLKKDGIKSLLSIYFNNFTFTDQMIMDLSKFDTVTPGDFGSLSGKIRFMSKEKITPEFIIRELQNIQSEKQKNGGRTIGFAS